MRLALTIAVLLAGTAPALAQPTTVDARVGKLEKEMRAVQRKVFPDGSQQFLEAEIRPAAPAATPAGVPASGAINDLTARVDTLERQLQTMTGQIEQNQFRLRQIEEQLAKFRTDAEYRIGALEGSGAAPRSTGTTNATQPLPPEAEPPVAMATPAPRPPRIAPRTDAPVPAPAPVQAAPAASGDPAEDAYMAGYRLWTAKDYAGAQAALKAAAAKYPKHRRYSYAQNLLGRAYLDEGKPALAAEAFYANYRAMPRGERAPDSLYFLGQSLTRLQKTSEACRVYDELRDVYGEKIDTTLKTRLTTARADAKCGA